MAEVKTTGVPAEKPAASAIPASTTASATRTAPGLTFRRLFTKPGVSPYDEIEWEKRIAQITDSKGGVIFEQKDVEVPKDWSMTATNIVASKYLHGTLGTPERESGVRALVTRVAETIRDWGLAQGYFRTPEDGATFHDELAHILLRQYAAFNSPVWFNVGCDRIEPNSDGQNWHWNAKTQTVEFGITGYSKPLAIPSRSAPPASSILSKTRSIPSSRSPKPKACSSSGDQAPAPTFLRCVLPQKVSAAAALPAVRLAS